MALAASVTLGASAPSSPSQADAPNAIVQQPRAFGHVIGDIVTQRVLLQVNGAEFVPAELPNTGRVGIWFERRTVRVEKDNQGRRWLAVDYQLMNAPQTLAVARVPAWKLKALETDVELRVPEWVMTVSPLTAQQPFTRAGLGNLRPDRSASFVPLTPTRNAFAIGMVGMILSLAGWIGWWAWRNWRASSSQPFAVALREMRNVDDTSPQAWHALHRAFDGTAGRATRTETLPVLFQRAPYLQPLRPAIERFFNESGARFFAGKEIEHSVSVHALCRDLRRIEKRHER